MIVHLRRADGTYAVVSVKGNTVFVSVPADEIEAPKLKHSSVAKEVVSSLCG